MDEAADREAPAPRGGRALTPYRDRSYYAISGNICELDHVVVKEEEWHRMPESRESGWSFLRRDGLVVAYRFSA